MNLSCGQMLKTCYVGDSCPPILAQALTQYAPAGGFMPAFVEDDLVCDYGMEILELSGKCCAPNQDPCDVIGSVLNRAMAEVYTAISAEGYFMPLMVGRKPLFDTANEAPDEYFPGSAKHTVYWVLRNHVHIIARFLMYKEARRLEEAKPSFFVIYENLKAEIKDGIKLPQYVQKAKHSASGIAVAGRAVCAIPFDDYCAPANVGICSR